MDSIPDHVVVTSTNPLARVSSREDVASRASACGTPTVGEIDRDFSKPAGVYLKEERLKPRGCRT